MDEDDKEYIFRWGLPLNELYAVALNFYKEKEGNVIQFSYGEKLKLLAYIRQVAHGKYNEDLLSPLGVLDVIGRDRRMAWHALGDMKQRDAMAAFVQLIDKSCLHFKTFVQAQKAAMDEQKRKAEEKKQMEIEMQERSTNQNDEIQNKQKGKYKDEDARKRQIQDALNAQTFDQFKSYAEQQYPGNPEEQAVLIRQLQDQHYHQYMLQLKQQRQEAKENVADAGDAKQKKLRNGNCQQNRNNNHNDSSSSSNDKNNDDGDNNNAEKFGCGKGGGGTATSKVVGNKHCHHCVLQQVKERQIKHEKAVVRYHESSEVENIIDTRQQRNNDQLINTTIDGHATTLSVATGDDSNELNLLINPDTVSRVVNNENSSDSEDSEGELSITQSFMWTRKDIEEFKSEIKKEGGETIIKVSHGEIVTIRVPTREDGNYLYWEFATDNYDIGFGVHFEWEKSSTNEVSIHVSESEDDSDDLLDEDQDLSDVDAEQSQLSRSSARMPKTPTSVIVPIYRRDCHQEVYFGYHKYPAEGVYLLKFDNSYSLWRSKTLYYRIYYTNHTP